MVPKKMGLKPYRFCHKNVNAIVCKCDTPIMDVYNRMYVRTLCSSNVPGVA